MFKYGDLGDRFYLILDGGCSINIPLNYRMSSVNNINLQNSNLNNADFTGVSFGNANLSQASMINTIFSNADLSMAFGLKQEQLDKACGNINTRLPLGLILHFCNGIDSTNTNQSSTKGVDQAIRDVEVGCC